MTRWQEDAKCATEDPRMWFEINTTPERAAELCAGCPVTVECLEAGLEPEMPHGVWGGRTEVELRKMRRRRRKATT